MVLEYYQLGGFRSHIDWPEYQYDDKRLAQIIAGDNSPLRTRGQSAIELVFGIKRVGTSHLLLTKEQIETLARTFRKPYPRAPPARSTDFESLSPVYFHNTTELTNKLSLLKPKSMKNRTPGDNSQANRQYKSGEDGIPRGEFEHGRSFCLILHNKLDIDKYCLSSPSWKQSVQVYSFAFTQRSPDTRAYSERLKNPSVLDCGLAQSTLPDLRYCAGSAIHLYSITNRNLNAGSKKMLFTHGTTNDLNSTQITAYLKNFFIERTGAGSGPMILLVHDEQSGIKNLLGFGGLKGSERSHNRRESRGNNRGGHSNEMKVNREMDDYEARRNRPRSRSRSPRRTSDPRSYPSSSHMSPSLPYSDSTSTPEPLRKSYAPVYVVDIKKQFSVLMQTATSSESPMKISQYLGMSDSSMNGWCAGNGAVMQIEIWHSMVSGLPIDDQKALREQGIEQNLSGLKNPGVENGRGPTDYDSDQDPNDVVQVSQPAYDEDSDFGESSGSDD